MFRSPSLGLRLRIFPRFSWICSQITRSMMGSWKMAQLPTQRIGAYLRKMAIDGYIIYTNTADIKAFTSELSAIGRNINQIAKRLNAGGPAYQADIQEIRERLDAIWQLQRRILSSQH